MNELISQARAARTIEDKLKILSKAIVSDDPEERIQAVDILSTLPGSEAMDTLMDRLNTDPDPGVKNKIKVSLAEQGTRMIPTFIDILKNAVSETAYPALEVLLEIKPENRVSEVLLKTYQDADESLKLSINSAMKKIEGEKATAFLVINLKDPDDPYRAPALEMLAEFDGTSDLKVLEKKYNIPPESPAAVEVADLKTVADFKLALRSKDDEVRVKVMEKIRAFGKEEYIPALVDALKDSNLGVRIIAVQSLSQFDNDATIEPLIKALDDPNDVVQLASIKALLKNVDHPRVTGALLRSIKSPNKNVQAIAITEMAKKTNRNYMQSREKGNKKESEVFNRVQTQLVGNLMKLVGKELDNLQQDISITVVELIMAIGTGSEIGELLHELTTSEDPKIRAVTMKVLGQLGDVEVVDVLLRGLKDSDLRVRANSIEALEKVGLYKTMNLILPYLRDRNPRIRASSAKALYSFGNPNGLKVLQEMITNPEAEMRTGAAWALGEIQSNEAMKMLAASARVETDERVKKILYGALVKIKEAREKAQKRKQEQK